MKLGKSEWIPIWDTKMLRKHGYYMLYLFLNGKSDWLEDDKLEGTNLIWDQYIITSILFLIFKK